MRHCWFPVVSLHKSTLEPSELVLSQTLCVGAPFVRMVTSAPAAPALLQQQEVQWVGGGGGLGGAGGKGGGGEGGGGGKGGGGEGGGGGAGVQAQVVGEAPKRRRPPFQLSWLLAETPAAWPRLW